MVELETYNKVSYKDLMEKTEELSRNKFPGVLKNGGYVIGPKKPQSDEKIPPEIEKLLGEMNFISQYSAVRQLHELIRTRGESPFLQGGLVRGYANLGLLSQYNWHPAFKVFFARSLLYAQRMVAQGVQRRWARWHRAYAFALTGLQKNAIKDLDEAEKEGQLSVAAKDAGDYAKPPWVDAISAFCRYDTKSLKPDWTGSENVELTGLLQCVANELAVNGDLIVTKAMEMLEKTPECYRLYNVVCRYGGVIVGHTGTTACFQVFREKSYPRLARIPGLPDNAANVIRRLNSPARFFGNIRPGADNPAGEFSVRRELMPQLFTPAPRQRRGKSANQQCRDCRLRRAFLGDAGPFDSGNVFVQAGGESISKRICSALHQTTV